MQELLGLGILIAGALIVLAGLVWLVAQGFRIRWWLGVMLMLTAPFGTPLIFGLVRFRQAKRPLLLVVVGLVVGAVPFGYVRGYEYLYGLHERERLIDGERHLVLTGWDRPNYDILAKKTDVVVLELGNSDVTDATLERLLPMSRLRELTLNDSSVTDAGFDTLRRLPALESLRMARTKITRDGVAGFLADPPPQLKQIDVSGNSIPASALRKWKNLDPEHRRYVN